MPKRFDRVLKPGESTGNLIPWYQRTVLWGGLYFLAKFFWSFGGWPHYEVLPFQFPVPTKLDWRMSLNWRNLIWFPSHHDPGTSPGIWGWFWVQAIGGAITSFSYPSLSGHLEWTGDGLVPEPDPNKGQGATPYAGGPFTVQTSDEHPFTVLFVLQPVNWWIFEWYLLSGLSFEFIVAPEEEQTDEYREWYDDYYRDYPGGSEFPTIETDEPDKRPLKQPHKVGDTRGKLPSVTVPVDWEPGKITPVEGPEEGWLPEAPHKMPDPGDVYPLPNDPGMPGKPTTTPTTSDPETPDEPQDPGGGGGTNPKTPGSPGGSIPPGDEDTKREIIIVLKDYDIYYIDQNENLEPVVNIGPPVVARAGENISLSASLSWSLTSPIASCFWDIGNAQLVSGNLTDPEIIVKWDNEGQYQFSCTLTTEAGKSATGYRNAYIFGNTYEPEDNFVLDSLSGTENGWSAEITVFNPSDISKYAGGREIVIFFERFVEGVPTSLSTESSGRYKLLFRGWIDGASLKRDPDGKWISFSALGPAKYMETQENFAVALNNVTPPIDWTEFPNLTCHGALFHLLKWHSTILDITDLHIPHYTEVERLLGGFEFKEESVAKQAATLAEATLAKFGSARDGSLWFTIDPINTPRGVTKSLLSAWTDTVLTEDNSLEEMEVLTNKIYKTGRVEVSGVAFHMDYAEAAIASSPGGAPLYGGRGQRVEKLALKTGMEAGEIARHMLSQLNRDIEEISLATPGTYGIDLFPIRTVKVTYPDPKLGLEEAECVLTAVDITYEEKGKLIEELTLVPLVEPKFYATITDSTVTNVSLVGGGGAPSYSMAYPLAEVYDLEPESRLPAYLSMASRSEYFFCIGAELEDGSLQTFYFLCPEIRNAGPINWYQEGGLIPLAENSVDVFRPPTTGPFLWVRQTDKTIKEIELSATEEGTLEITETRSWDTNSWDLDYEFLENHYETVVGTNGFTLYRSKTSETDYLLTFIIFPSTDPEQPVVLHQFLNPNMLHGLSQMILPQNYTLPLHASKYQEEDGTWRRTYTTFLPVADPTSWRWGIYEIGFILYDIPGKPLRWEPFAEPVFLEEADALDLNDPSITISTYHEPRSLGLRPTNRSPSLDSYLWYNYITVECIVTARKGKLTRQILSVGEGLGYGDTVYVRFPCTTHFGARYNFMPELVSTPLPVGSIYVQEILDATRKQPICSFQNVAVTKEKSYPAGEERTHFRIHTTDVDAGKIIRIQPVNEDYVWCYTNILDTENSKYVLKLLGVNRGSPSNPLAFGLDLIYGTGGLLDYDTRWLTTPDGEIVKGTAKRISDVPWKTVIEIDFGIYEHGY